MTLISYGKRNQIADRVRRLFGGMPCRLQVAALPWRASGGEVEVLMVTSRQTRRWVLPKGWPEAGEQLHEAAAREAAEEAGVEGSVSNFELGRFFYGKELSSGLERRCEVLVFPLEVAHTGENWPERKQRDRRWFRARDAALLVREPDLGELIAEFGETSRATVA